MQRIAVVGKEVHVMLGFRGELMKQMVARGHLVYAFATDYTDETEVYVRSLGFIPVRYQLDGYTLNPLHELKVVCALYRAFKLYKITVSYCYFAKPALYGTYAAWLAKIPHRVAKLEGLGRPFTQTAGKKSMRLVLAKWFQKRLFKWILPKATTLVLLNHDDQQEIAHICGAKQPKTTLLGGIGVCLDKFSASEPSVYPVRFIFSGRLLNEKGIRYYLQAAEQVKRKHPTAEFWVIGLPDALHGISERELNVYIKKRVVNYFGHVDNVTSYLHKSSVFVLPSYYREGLPRSSQEALAIGRPIITTDAPGCRETVNQGVNGYLVKPHDTHSLIAAMEKLINNPDLIVSMGRASRQLAETKFNVIEVNERMLEVLGL